MLTFSITKGMPLRRLLLVCPLPTILIDSLVDQLSHYSIVLRSAELRLLAVLLYRPGGHVVDQTVEAYPISYRVLPAVCHLATDRTWPLLLIVQMGYSTSLTRLSEPDIPTPQLKWRT